MGDIINIGKAFNELSEKEQEDFVDKFFDEKSEEEQIAVLMKALDNLQFSGSVSMEEIMSDLVKCFKTILKELKIQEVTEFTFVDYDYPRLIIINGKEYDLDGAFDKDEDAEAFKYAYATIVARTAFWEVDADKELVKTLNHLYKYHKTEMEILSFTPEEIAVVTIACCGNKYLSNGKELASLFGANYSKIKEMINIVKGEKK
jgi:hypothetical protein